MAAGRTVQFTAEGFRSQEIEIAPDVPMQKLSKRYAVIKEEVSFFFFFSNLLLRLLTSVFWNKDIYLDSNISDLDAGTRARNQAFQDRLDEIWRSSAVFESKIRTEAREAAETVLDMRDEYKQHIENNLRNLNLEISKIFDKIDNQVLKEESKRIDMIDHNAQVFTKQIVPATIEKQSGEVSRNLRRAYETFDIEKKKEFKR